MSENLAGISLEDQFSLAQKQCEDADIEKEKAEENRRKLQDLLSVRDAVISELEKRYKLDNLGNLILKFDQFLVTFENYIESDEKTSKEPITNEVSGVRKELKDFLKNLRVG